MEFHCVDFPHYGVLLIPPTSPDYAPLLADIQLRIAHPVEGSPPPLPESMRGQILDQDRETSAILLNRSPHGIAAIQQIWTLEETNGRKGSNSIGGGANSSILLPFGLPENLLKLYGYWHVILPGSKRYLNANGEQVGDNSDVRPPAPEEMWSGGIMGGRSGGNRSRGPMKSVTFTLDGVFSDDGGFLGPNQMGLWEQTVFAAEAHLQVAKLARQGHDKGDAPQQILATIESVTGSAKDFPPPPPPPPGARTPEMYRESALQRLAWEIGNLRKTQGDEHTVYMILAWADRRVPDFRKLR